MLLFSGCTYAISKDMTARADKTITFEQVSSDPETHKGKILIIGGVIVAVRNTAQGAMIEVGRKSLDIWGRPKRTLRTEGGFIIRHDGYLNAITYSPGRELTAAAEVSGETAKSLESVQTYPLFISRELKLWERQRPAPDGPSIGDPLYDPYGSFRTY